jgi:hypothetical protein
VNSAFTQDMSAKNCSLTLTAAASHQYYCLAKQLLINHVPIHNDHAATIQGIVSSTPSNSPERKPLTTELNQQAETTHLLRRACAVAESHTNTMGIVLMTTLPILACRFRPILFGGKRFSVLLLISITRRRPSAPGQRFASPSPKDSAESAEQLCGVNAAWHEC